MIWTVTMLTIKELKETFTRYDFAPLKRLGENYLIDANIKNKIIAAADISKDDTILEIGPGLGALTADLAGTGARVIAVEKDRKACEALRRILGDNFPNLEITNGDILQFDLSRVARGKNVKVVGNLPYYITTPIIEYILRNKGLISEAIIMVQKEVASRLLAGAGSRDYGSLSCFLQYHTRPEHIYAVKRTCFYPEPDVDSSIVKLIIPENPSVSVKNEDLFFKIVRGAFNQRRKTIINSLSREAVLNIAKADLTAILNTAGIDPAARPETLSLADFAKIANCLRKAHCCGNL
ncbi:MAG: 16S rRNA (adenine(1518)-N(6)/adenine(1519)-N(6))-dimethyltransferase RsmA [Candidatus Omnitrophota bacterium]|nr:16S rRNA (adenine(1518)-N(6)/adenine(1519)-N(6))-dimethyltransferase RsmA [Candidatus Omnitrophota bacterium]